MCFEGMGIELRLREQCFLAILGSQVYANDLKVINGFGIQEMARERTGY